MAPQCFCLFVEARKARSRPSRSKLTGFVRHAGQPIRKSFFQFGIVCVFAFVAKFMDVLVAELCMLVSACVAMSFCERYDLHGQRIVTDMSRRICFYF